MKNIKLMNKIAEVGTNLFDKAKYNVDTDISTPDAMMVRSAALHDLVFNPELLAIARCGAGVNNIPIDRCTEAGIVVFNTPGANANGVKELAVCALLLAARDIVGGIEWAKTLGSEEDAAKAVEAGKSKFAGTELQGKKLGVIGLGAIGGMIANTAKNLGMEVMGCDPYLTIDGAWNLSHSVNKAASNEEIFTKADYITLHVPATKETKNMINKDTIAMMKDGVKIINLARADLVNADDIKEALASGKVSRYVTDFPTNATVGVPGIIAIPHLGASTVESEDNCAVMAARQLIEFLELGNIKNSVNFPNVSIQKSADARLCIMHKNIPSILSQLTTALSDAGINIENLSNGSKGDNAYTIMEIKGAVPEKVADSVRSISGVIKVNIIH